ncbi:AraC family transcriptional regulator [Herbaspirillum sp. alder98]|uniref:AraC family transcriptional regulator n=1 Tax=Herbaspirillum sp. alder98 TaxID=2913096 RepID=UPI001CD824CC|nr:AraC family transcriptional regulator [Herbaspirillum sp. alder98]MCA1323417.1 AraC family transcriptional regulator [Herbaspirillum sp. alder98]
MLSASRLDVRSYGGETLTHSHDFAQLVLPLSGRIALDIDGRSGVADGNTAAFVEPGAHHATSALGDNRALIVDLSPDVLEHRLLEQFGGAPFVSLTPAAGKLVDFMQLLLGRQQASSANPLQHWLPLLLDTMAGQAPRAQSRLQLLMARIEAEPAQPWSIADMAASAAISPSRLHEWFQAETGTSPRAWLAEVRVRHACYLLRHSSTPLALVAQRCGYADQSALSHALRRLRQTTPAAYRRAAQSPAEN